MEIRPAEAAHQAGILATIEAAFADEGPAVTAMVQALDRSAATRASLVALDGDQVVGHVQLSRCWIDARRALVEALMLTPLSVHPDHQGRGHGTRLLAAARSAAEDLGATAIFLEGDWRYYGPRGWEPAARHGLLRPSPRIPEPAFQVVLLAAHQAWMTGPMVYPEAVWATDTAGLRDPTLAEVEAAVSRSAGSPAGPDRTPPGPPGSAGARPPGSP